VLTLLDSNLGYTKEKTIPQVMALRKEHDRVYPALYLVRKLTVPLSEEVGEVPVRDAIQVVRCP
jgi:hypothetical protein